MHNRVFFSLIASVILSACEVPGGYPTSYQRPPQRDPMQQVFRGISQHQLNTMKNMREEKLAQAAQGDEEAQRWLNENSSLVDMMENIYNKKAAADDSYYNNAGYTY